MTENPKPAPSLQPAAQPPILAGDLQNLVVAARYALPQLDATSLCRVAASIARIEEVISAAVQAPKPEEKKAE
jgi:hypothetical protein